LALHRGEGVRFRRSEGSGWDRPNNVGATPRYPQYGGPRNVGATPRDPFNDVLNQLRGDPYPRQPKNVGATPRDPFQDVLNQLQGDPYPYDDDEGGENVGATRNNPWGGFWDIFRSWRSVSGNRKTVTKRAVGRSVFPNRVTIEEHSFKLDAMPEELRFEMFTAVMNHTKFEDLSVALHKFEI